MRTVGSRRASMLTALVFVGATLGVLAGVADAQVQYCEYGTKGIFHNPDLKPKEDGLVHASGRFLVQFQVLGERAAETEYLLFSIGRSMPSEDLESCEPTEYPLTGVYLPGYRSAENPESGFFIPINSTLVADGEYYASVAAYTADDEYLGHGWATAVVSNGCDIPCEAALEAGLVTHDQMRAKDTIMPWPWILPGDGEQVHAVGGLTIEFGEEVADARAWVTPPDGAPEREITSELEAWTPPERPDDLAPYPHSGSMSTRVWGSGFHWSGPVPDGTVVRVWAVDLNGNAAEKIVHVGSPTAGGIVQVDAPEVRLTTPLHEKRAQPGAAADFEVLLQNIGDGEAHVNLRALADAAGVSAQVDPPHVMIGSGGEASATLTVASDGSVAPGRYPAALVAEYKTGDGDTARTLNVTLNVGSVPESEGTPIEENATDADDAQEDDPIEGARSGSVIPGAGIPGVLALLATAAAVAARRRGAHR